MQPGRIREDFPEEVMLNLGGQISVYKNVFRDWGKAEGECFMSHEAGEKYRARLACWAQTDPYCPKDSTKTGKEFTQEGELKS